jgi:hypothetical protein
METQNLPAIRALRPAWYKGRIVGHRRPLKPKHVWAVRVPLELAENHRDLALFNLAIDSKLRGCDLVKMKVVDVMASGQIKKRASVLQSKTHKPVRFEISEGTRSSVAKWLEHTLMVGSEHLWPGRFSRALAHLYPPICPHCAGMGFIDWFSRDRLWNSLNAAHEGHANIQKDGQLARSSTSIGSHQNGQYGALSRR